MGLCCCRLNITEENNNSSRLDFTCCNNIMSSSIRSNCLKSCISPRATDDLILELLVFLDQLTQSDETSDALDKLIKLSESEAGYSDIMFSMMRVITLDDHLGPYAISLILESCALPSSESIKQICSFVDTTIADKSVNRGRIHIFERNKCLVLAGIAEKFDNQILSVVFSKHCLEYLVSMLHINNDPDVLLSVLIAVEKIAKSKNLKKDFREIFESAPYHPLLALEFYQGSEDRLLWRQIRFCARWALDNLFPVNGRILSYRRINLSNINAMLNVNDASKYLKIDPDGLEARSDSPDLESVRCTFRAIEGCWYYEALIVTGGVMQIGFATADSILNNHEYYGVGDDSYSLAYDGCRRLIWYKAESQRQHTLRWAPGDILGCLLDITKEEIIFSMNGIKIEPQKKIFQTVKSGFYAAASFMPLQQCKFNFGSENFKYPPKDRMFFTFNDKGYISETNKIIKPRRLIIEDIQNIKEDSCSICCDLKATIQLSPCGHTGICINCYNQLVECPFCRSLIVRKVK